MAYWSAHPGVALSIIEKLLNYSILTPATVINWALIGRAGSTRGEALATAHLYEMVFNTVMKVTGRVRQLATKPPSPPHQQAQSSADAEEAETREREIRAMRALFAAIEDALAAWAAGSKDEMMEASEGAAGDSETERLVRRWSERWLRVFRRRAAIEEAFLVEAEKERARLRAEMEEQAREQARERERERELVGQGGEGMEVV
jgi:nuclear cap-binding protein subunit 1